MKQNILKKLSYYAKKNYRSVRSRVFLSVYGKISVSKNPPNCRISKIKKKNELSDIFIKHKVDINKNLAFTCGSGITACVLGLANSIISGKKPVIYDGSWAAYGLK